MSQERVNLNEKIRAHKILLIDEEGKNLGIFFLRDALQKSKEVGLDLVEVGGKDMPVCKIMDYGKFKYEQTKSSKKNSKSQPSQIIKEIKFKPNTGINDLVYRAKHADSFLKEKNKIKISVKFRGREIEHSEITGKSIINKFLTLLKEPYNIEFGPKREGGVISLIIVSPSTT